jgi:O-antigen ligase
MIARAVFWLLLALVVLAPLPFGSNRPWAWDFLALASGGLLGFWALAASANPALYSIAWRHYRPPALLFAAFLLWAMFQTVSFSPDSWHHPSWQAAATALGQPLAGAIGVAPDDGRNGVMRLLCYGIVFWLAMQFGRRHARTIWWTLTLAITAYAIYGLIVQFSGSGTILWFPKWSYQGSLTSTFVNRNHFAAYAGVGLILNLALIAAEVKDTARHGLSTRSGFIYFIDHVRPPIFILMISFVVLTTALLLSHSRAGLFCSAIGVLVMLGAFGISQGLRSRSLILFGAIIFCVGIAILAISGDAVTARMGELIENAEPRAQIYALSLQAIAERPLLGTGLGSFEQIFRFMRGADFGASEPTYDVAHNSYLELAVEAGLPAAILFYAAMAIIVLVFLHGARERRAAIIYPCTGLATSALLGVHALVDFSLQIPAIAVTFAMIAGVAYAQSWRHEERRAEMAQIRE